MAQGVWPQAAAGWPRRGLARRCSAISGKGARQEGLIFEPAVNAGVEKFVQIFVAKSTIAARPRI